MEDGSFVRFCEVSVFHDLADLLLAELIVHFVGEIRRVDKGSIPHPSDPVREIRLASFTADEQPTGFDVANHIIAHVVALLKPEEFSARVVLDVGLIGAVEALQAQEQPGDASLHEADPDIGELVTDAVEDDAGEADHEAERVAQGVDRCIGIEVIHAEVLVGAPWMPRQQPSRFASA